MRRGGNQTCSLLSTHQPLLVQPQPRKQGSLPPFTAPSTVCHPHPNPITVLLDVCWNTLPPGSPSQPVSTLYGACLLFTCKYLQACLGSASSRLSVNVNTLFGELHVCCVLCRRWLSSAWPPAVQARVR